VSVVDVLQKNVDGIRRERGIPHINHPNFMWAMTADELREVQRYRLFEVFNGHPLVNQQGGGGVPGLEEVWDRLLSSGKLVYGIAVDDAHTFKQPGNANVAGPGRGWVMVQSARLEPRAMRRSARGWRVSTRRLAWSSSEVEVDPARVHVAVRRCPRRSIASSSSAGWAPAAGIDRTHRHLHVTGSEGYVRVALLESNGRVAWVQPVMVPVWKHPTQHRSSSLRSASGAPRALAHGLRHFRPWRRVSAHSPRDAV
jgi:hypothetical protein